MSPMDPIRPDEIMVPVTMHFPDPPAPRDSGVGALARLGVMTIVAVTAFMAFAALVGALMLGTLAVLGSKVLRSTRQQPSQF